MTDEDIGQMGVKAKMDGSKCIVTTTAAETWQSSPSSDEDEEFEGHASE